MTERLAIAFGLAMYALGFILAGAIYARTPFWDGVRSVVFWRRR